MPAPVVGTCPHCQGNLLLTMIDCANYEDRNPDSQPCPIPGFPHEMILCENADRPHVDAVEAKDAVVDDEGTVLEPAVAAVEAIDPCPHPDAMHIFAEANLGSWPQAAVEFIDALK